MKHPGNTPPFRGPRGEAVPGIAEIKYLRLGDVDQLVRIQGPGMSETSFFRHCNAALEKMVPQ